MLINFGQGNLGKIIVAIDFTDEGKVRDVSRACIEEAMTTAGQKVSTLVFTHILHIPEKLEEELKSGRNTEVVDYYRQIQSVLDALVKSARETGIPAKSVLLTGIPWLRLIQVVMQEEANLLLAGTGKPGSLWQALFGSTTMKLLRKCPCPVWVTKQQTTRGSVLVAHDMKDVGRKSLKWGARVAQERSRFLTVLHAIESGDVGRFWSGSAKEKKARRNEARETIRKQLSDIGFSGPVKISVEEGSPASLIHQHLKEMPVGLLVMGTVGRSGISGFLTGNTAETLLPLVDCSLVAIKPQGFVTPVQLDLPSRTG
jgi:universal stress protein E